MMAFVFCLIVKVISHTEETIGACEDIELPGDVNSCYLYIRDENRYTTSNPLLISFIKSSLEAAET